MQSAEDEKRLREVLELISDLVYDTIIELYEVADKNDMDRNMLLDRFRQEFDARAKEGL